MRTCKLCGKNISEKKNKSAIFCSHTCNTRFNAKKLYYERKDDPAYKKMQRENFDRWRKKNHAHFNEMMRRINKPLAKKRYLRRIKEHICIYCGKVPPTGIRRGCARCLKKNRERESKYRKS